MKTKQQIFHLYKITSKISLQHHPLKVTRMLRLNHQKVNKHKHEALAFQPFGQMTKPNEKHQAFFFTQTSTPPSKVLSQMFTPPERLLSTCLLQADL